MVAFGRKCPACGGKNLIARSSNSWLAALPAARSYACADCHQQIVQPFAFVAIGVEQRHLSRKRMPPFFLVRIPATNQYARIKNMSEGGLCFNLDYNALPPARRFLQLDLYNCNDGSSLEQIPAEIVATTKQTLVNNGFKTTVRNNCARFVNLNQAQRKVLATCLGQYGI
ncbi:MAG: PilZ domain-containing protein [Desulfobulbus sp.]|nr:PilZ domain-containing protein [Desulfobulbus sp.]